MGDNIVSTFLKRFSAPPQTVSAKIKPYEFAAKITLAFNQSFNEFVIVLMESMKNDFGINRSAFFLIDKDGRWRLKAKLGDELPDYNQPPSDDELIEIKPYTGILVQQPTDGIGFDFYIIIFDDRKKPIGVLAMDDTSQKRKFSEEEVESFGAIAETFNTLLRQKRIHDDLTIRDPLTGLYNRHIEKNIEKDFANVTCVWLLDIDHFKQINDRYGHPAGDTVLRHLAKYLKKNLRQDDDVAIRHGGEEFAIIMKGINPRMGLRRVEQMSKAFKSEEIVLPDGKTLSSITFSAGFVAPKKTHSLKDSLSRADKLLYVAKQQGRDRVVSEL